MLDNLLDTENRVESSVSQDKVNNSNLYLDETDSKGVPLLRRVEKYPDLPENEFIPIEYDNSKHEKLLKGRYEINKLGEIRNTKTKYILSSHKEIHGYKRVSLNKFIFMVHRLVAITFLENPDLNIYCSVNHIDHIRDNNKLYNLEWITPTENGSRSRGKYSEISENKLMQYIALDDSGNELFTINRRNNKGYNVELIPSYIASGYK